MKSLLASSTLGAQIFLAVSILGSAAGIWQFGLSAQTFLLILLGYFMYGCLGVVVTYHRYYTHNSYKTYTLLPKFFAILGCLGGTGSPLAWVAIHINHHLNSDNTTDPHSPLHKGLGIFGLDYEGQVNANTKWKMRSMITDSFQQVLHR